MKLHSAEIIVATTERRQLVDITERVRQQVLRSGVQQGLCALYAQGATAALMIQENDDPNITLDVLDCLADMVPDGRWRHDKVDSNGAAHI